MPAYQNILESPIEYLKGVGPAKAQLLNKEISVFKFRDLLMHFPYRYIDRTRFHQVKDTEDSDRWSKHLQSRSEQEDLDSNRLSNNKVRYVLTLSWIHT